MRWIVRRLRAMLERRALAPGTPWTRAAWHGVREEMEQRRGPPAAAHT